MSAVQFNLLPDVKVDYARAKLTQDKVTKIASLVAGTTLAILIILLISVDVLQKKQLSDANGQVNQAASQLQAVPNLSKVLTVQYQLQTLATLHSSKHISSRLFTYLSQLTPAKASLGQLTLDIAHNVVTISGTADSQATVNTFIDTLKFANFQIGIDSTTYPAFTSVVESSFNINPTNVSYTLNVQFDPRLFANNLTDSQGQLQSPKLVIKTQTTTRSALSTPSDLFNGQTGGSSTGGQ